MADLIDRQTAIDTAIEAADKWDGGYSSEREGIIRKFFDKIPAVQPDHTADSGKKVSIPCAHENDLIFRQAAIDALDCINGVEEVLRSLPSAQPEIIRCKDCKFSHMTNDGRYCKYCDQFTDDYGELVEMYFDSNFYCGYAERRTE